MDNEVLMMLGTAALILLVAIVWWRWRAGKARVLQKLTKAAPRDKRRGPRRIHNSRRESFRMGDDDRERRSGEDRRDRKPGWDDDTGKR